MNNFKIGINFENWKKKSKMEQIGIGTNFEYELGQISKIEQLSKWEQISKLEQILKIEQLTNWIEFYI
jgi:hypothetical protein